MEFLSDIASLINSTLRISTPLIFANIRGVDILRVELIKEAMSERNSIIRLPLC